MSEPKVADNKPVKVALTAGKDYFFCACGKSNKQPFCDGSHAGTEFRPKKFTADVDAEKFLCQCKQTSNPPYCDGSHKHVASD